MSRCIIHRKARHHSAKWLPALAQVAVGVSPPLTKPGGETSSGRTVESTPLRFSDRAWNVFCIGLDAHTSNPDGATRSSQIGDNPFEPLRVVYSQADHESFNEWILEKCEEAISGTELTGKEMLLGLKDREVGSKWIQAMFKHWSETRVSDRNGTTEVLCVNDLGLKQCRKHNQQETSSDCRLCLRSVLGQIANICAENDSEKIRSRSSQETESPVQVTNLVETNKDLGASLSIQSLRGFLKSLHELLQGDNIRDYDHIICTRFGPQPFQFLHSKSSSLSNVESETSRPSYEHNSVGFLSMVPSGEIKMQLTLKRSVAEWLKRPHEIFSLRDSAIDAVKQKAESKEDNIREIIDFDYSLPQLG